MLEYFILFIVIGFVMSLILDYNDAKIETGISIFIMVAIIWGFSSGIIWGFAALAELFIGALLYSLVFLIYEFIYENRIKFIFGGIIVIIAGGYVYNSYPQQWNKISSIFKGGKVMNDSKYINSQKPLNTPYRGLSCSDEAYNNAINNGFSPGEAMDYVDHMCN